MISADKSFDITSHNVEVNGVNIHYDKAGRGNQILLLLPGALGTSRTDFSPQLEHLDRQKFTIIAWDPRGYGKSFPPARSNPDFFYERDADDATELLQKIGYEKYSLLGWSDGGITAVIMAGRFPERVQKLIIWGSNAYVTQEEVDNYDHIRDVANWSPRMRDPFVKIYGMEYFRKMWNENLDALIVYMDKRNGDICKQFLRKITCPSLIIHGVKDPLVPEYHARYLHENIQNSRLHLMPDGKHNLHLRFYEEFNTLVQAFLADSKI